MNVSKKWIEEERGLYHYYIQGSVVAYIKINSIDLNRIVFESVIFENDRNDRFIFQELKDAKKWVEENY